jgi:hypothetical protein
MTNPSPHLRLCGITLMHMILKNQLAFEGSEGLPFAKQVDALAEQVHSAYTKSFGPLLERSTLIN